MKFDYYEMKRNKLVKIKEKVLSSENLIIDS